MDWSKAKTVLIIALLAVCVLLSAILVYGNIEEAKEAKQTVLETKAYLESVGIKLDVDIPSKTPALPVIFVEYSKDNSKGKMLKYKDYELCVGTGDNSYSFIEAGTNTAKVMSASSAVLQVAASPSIYSNYLEIKDIELVYYIDSSNYASSPSRDTAIPSWKIDTNHGLYYINAFAK